MRNWHSVSIDKKERRLKETKNVKCLKDTVDYYNEEGKKCSRGLYLSGILL